MDMLKAIFERRSIRKYTGDPVSREQLLTLVKAGMAAPSSRDTRHFNFVIVDDNKMIDKLAEGLPYAKMLETARHAIIVASDLSVAYGGFEIDYWLQDCSAAAENVLLAAQALGLGACWTGVHPREERVFFIKNMLGLPENVRPLCVIAVGIPVGKEKIRDKFDPSHVFWNKWGS
jgi:nitroreductase